MASKQVFGALARTSVSGASTSRAASMSTATAVESKRTPLPPALPSSTGKFLDFDRIKPLKPTHGQHVATLQLRAHTTLPLDLYSQFALQAAKSLKIPTSGVASLPKTEELVTVIKSHFVMKKTQENFKRPTHRRAIKVFDADRDVLDLWLRYINNNSVPGVGIKAYVHEYVEFGAITEEFKGFERLLEGGAESEVEKAAAEAIKMLSGPEFEPEVKKVEKEVEKTAGESAEVSAEAESAGEKVEESAEKVEESAKVKADAAEKPAEVEAKPESEAKPEAKSEPPTDTPKA